MILYEPGLPSSLYEFGIRIPIRDDRTRRTFQTLQQDARLSSHIGHWHVAHIDEQLTRNDLKRAHQSAYVDELYSDALEGHVLSTYELTPAFGHRRRYTPETASRPLADLFVRMRHIAAGTLQCARMALNSGFCFYFSGGMHHAHADHGSGFCLINDIVIAARKLQAEKQVRRIWVIDTDAHKGDGTAALTANDPTITTLSIHMACGWPLDGPPVLANGRPNPAFTPSDIDIGIAAGQEDQYNRRLKQGLDELGRSGPADLAIVVNGADPFEEDALASTTPLRLSLAQLAARDRMVDDFVRRHNVPMAVLMAGGYGETVWRVWADYLKWALAVRLAGG